MEACFGEVGGSFSAGLGTSVGVSTGTSADGYTMMVVSPEIVVGARGLTLVGVAPLPGTAFGGATNTIWTGIR